MKRFLNKVRNTCFLTGAFILTSIYSNVVISQNYCDSNPVDIHGDLSVIGNKIVDQNNSPVSFAGNSMFWSNTDFGAEKYYNANVVSWLKEDWGTTIVRAAMGVDEHGGYLTFPTANKNRVTAIVDAAIAEGLYVIIDWHSHNAENHEQEAIDFFKEMATLYGNYPNVIYEVYNEPIHVSWSNDVKPYAEAVISEIRAIDPDNLIIVGSPTWSQDVDVASNDPIRSSTNIAYTLHFYAATHGASLRAKAQRALDNGIALMVTEWGTVSASGDGNVDNNSTDQWMDFLEENDISHLNWSVHDKSEGASILRPGGSPNGNWSDSDLTASGLKVKSIVESWVQYCEGEPIDPIIVNEIIPVDNYTAIPALVEAEDYNSQSGTQTEDTEDTNGGENVGFIDANDSLSYNIDVPSSGNYTIDFRVASLRNGASFDIYSGNSVIGNISTEATRDWQNWITVSETVTLSQGEQTIRLVATGGGWNINWLVFSEGEGSNEEPTEEEPVVEEEPIEEAGPVEEEPVEPNTESSNCSDLSTWSPSVAYSEAGTRIVYENIIYENKWYTMNQNPVNFSANPWDLWTVIGACTVSSKNTSSLGLNLQADITTNSEIELSGVTAYPNPYSESITVSNIDQEGRTVQLLNLSGAVIIQRPMNIGETVLNNLEGLANGLYLLQVVDSNNQILKTIKVVKE